MFDQSVLLSLTLWGLNPFCFCSGKAACESQLGFVFHAPFCAAQPEDLLVLC